MWDTSIKPFLTDPNGGGPAVLNWMVQGARKFLEAGKLNVPAVIKGATASLRDKNDIIREFLDDECKIGTGLKVSISELWERFDRWQSHSSHVPISKSDLGQRLEERGFTAGKFNGVRYRHGLTIEKSTKGDYGGHPKNILEGISLNA